MISFVFDFIFLLSQNPLINRVANRILNRVAYRITNRVVVSRKNGSGMGKPPAVFPSCQSTDNRRYTTGMKFCWV
jgi:hypothetical protein